MAASTSLLPVAGVKPRLQTRLSKMTARKRLHTSLTTWPDMDTVPSQPGDLIAMRLLLLRSLVQSLEFSQVALARNDAEMITRGAAHQAELCHQWSLLEDQLRRSSEQRPLRLSESVDPSPEALPLAQLEQEFAALSARIRHLTRVHCSLLRHLQRSLAIVAHVVESCSPTYAPELTLIRAETRPQAGD